MITMLAVKNFIKNSIGVYQHARIFLSDLRSQCDNRYSSLRSSAAEAIQLSYKNRILTILGVHTYISEDNFYPLFLGVGVKFAKFISLKNIFIKILL